MSDRRRISNAVFHRAILSLAGFLVLLAAAMFLPAGDIRWVRGWLFLLILFFLMVPSVVYLWRTNPDIFAARAHIHASTKRWDKVLLAFLLASFMAIDTGPYTIVRHPIYLGALLPFAGIPPALGSFRALVPAAVAILLIMVRTVLEDRTLRNERQGYKGYAARVRHRLVPGVW